MTGFLDKSGTPSEYSQDIHCYACGRCRGKLYLDERGRYICESCERLEDELQNDFWNDEDE